MIAQPASLGALAVGALRACAAHFPVFAAAALLGLGAEAAIYFLLHPKFGTLAGDAIIPPVLVTIVYVYLAANVSIKEIHGIARPWERILERVWAVVVIDFITDIILIVALSYAVTSLLNAILSAAVIFMYATLIFADVYAATEPDVSPLFVVPLAFMRSISLSWQKGNITRVLLILALWLLSNAMQTGFVALLGHWHVPAAAFWGDVPLTLVTTVLIGAFTALVYFDCIARERLSSDKRD